MLVPVKQDQVQLAWLFAASFTDLLQPADVDADLFQPFGSSAQSSAKTCGDLWRAGLCCGPTAAPASSDVFASVRSVLGDVVTRCSSILGASSTVFKLVQILGAV